MNNVEIKRRLWGRRKRRECFHCGALLHFGQATVDHYVPKAIGGAAGPSNAVISCEDCNSAKGGAHPVDYALGKLTTVQLTCSPKEG